MSYAPSLPRIGDRHTARPPHDSTTLHAPKDHSDSSAPATARPAPTTLPLLNVGESPAKLNKLGDEERDILKRALALFDNVGERMTLREMEEAMASAGLSAQPILRRGRTRAAAGLLVASPRQELPEGSHPAVAAPTTGAGARPAMGPAKSVALNTKAENWWQALTPERARQVPVPALRDAKAQLSNSIERCEKQLSLMDMYFSSTKGIGGRRAERQRALQSELLQRRKVMQLIDAVLAEHKQRHADAWSSRNEEIPIPSLARLAGGNGVSSSISSSGSISGSGKESASAQADDAAHKGHQELLRILKLYEMQRQDTAEGPSAPLGATEKGRHGHSRRPSVLPLLRGDEGEGSDRGADSAAPQTPHEVLANVICPFDPSRIESRLRDSLVVPVATAVLNMKQRRVDHASAFIVWFAWNFVDELVAREVLAGNSLTTAVRLATLCDCTLTMLPSTRAMLRAGREGKKPAASSGSNLAPSVASSKSAELTADHGHSQSRRTSIASVASTPTTTAAAAAPVEAGAAAAEQSSLSESETPFQLPDMTSFIVRAAQEADASSLALLVSSRSVIAEQSVLKDSRIMLQAALGGLCDIVEKLVQRGAGNEDFLHYLLCAFENKDVLRVEEDVGVRAASVLSRRRISGLEESYSQVVSKPAAVPGEKLLVSKESFRCQGSSAAPDEAGCSQATVSAFPFPLSLHTRVSPLFSTEGFRRLSDTAVCGLANAHHVAVRADVCADDAFAPRWYYEVRIAAGELMRTGEDVVHVGWVTPGFAADGVSSAMIGNDVDKQSVGFSVVAADCSGVACHTAPSPNDGGLLRSLTPSHPSLHLLAAAAPTPLPPVISRAQSSRFSERGEALVTGIKHLGGHSQPQCTVESRVLRLDLGFEDLLHEGHGEDSLGIAADVASSPRVEEESRPGSSLSSSPSFSSNVGTAESDGSGPGMGSVSHHHHHQRLSVSQEGDASSLGSDPLHVTGPTITIGCLLDFTRSEVSFSVNGVPQGVAYDFLPHWPTNDEAAAAAAASPAAVMSQPPSNGTPGEVVVSLPPRRRLFPAVSLIRASGDGCIPTAEFIFDREKMFSPPPERECQLFDHTAKINRLIDIAACSLPPLRSSERAGGNDGTDCIPSKESLNGATPSMFCNILNRDTALTLQPVAMTNASLEVAAVVPDASTRITHSRARPAPIHTALYQRHRAAAAALATLPHCDVYAPDSIRHTPLMLACALGYDDVVSVLMARATRDLEALARHAALQSKVSSNSAALSFLSFVNRQRRSSLFRGNDGNFLRLAEALDAVRKFLERLLIGNEQGLSPLHVSLLMQHHDCCALMLGLLSNLRDKSEDEEHAVVMSSIISSIVNARTPQGNTPLLLACKQGFIDVAQSLLDLGADPYCCDTRNITPLLAAAVFDFRELSMVVLRQCRQQQQQQQQPPPSSDVGASGFALRNYINEEVKGGNGTALLWAAHHGHSEFVRELILGGADTSFAMDGAPPLLVCIAAGHGETAHVMLKVCFAAAAAGPSTVGQGICGGKPAQRKHNTHQAAHAALVSSDCHGACGTFGGDERPCSLASPDGSSGCDTSANDDTGGHSSSDEERSESGARPERRRGKQASSASQRHVRRFRPKFACIIPLDLHSTDRHNGCTALHLAAEHGFSDVVKALILRGAPINALNKMFATPLHTAVANGHERTALEILMVARRCCDVTLLDAAGNSVLHCACAAGLLRVIEHLLAVFADTLDVNGHNRGGRTPLLVAVESGQPEAAEVLLNSIDDGAATRFDYNHAVPFPTKGCAPQSAVEIAIGKGFLSLSKLLVQRGARVSDKARDALETAAAAAPPAAAANGGDPQSPASFSVAASRRQRKLTTVRSSDDPRSLSRSASPRRKVSTCELQGKGSFSAELKRGVAGSMRNLQIAVSRRRSTTATQKEFSAVSARFDAEIAAKMLKGFSVDELLVEFSLVMAGGAEAATKGIELLSFLAEHCETHFWSTEAVSVARIATTFLQAHYGTSIMMPQQEALALHRSQHPLSHQLFTIIRTHHPHSQIVPKLRAAVAAFRSVHRNFDESSIADILVAPVSGRTLLHLACSLRCAAAISYLVHELHCDPNITVSPMSEDELFAAAVPRCGCSMRAALGQTRDASDAPFLLGERRSPAYPTPLRIAVRNRDVASVRALLAASADPNMLESEEITPSRRTVLHDAVVSGKVEIIQLLLSHNSVSVGCFDRDGDDAWLLAATHENPKVLLLLVTHAEQRGLHNWVVCEQASDVGRCSADVAETDRLPIEASNQGSRTRNASVGGLPSRKDHGVGSSACGHNEEASLGAADSFSVAGSVADACTLSPPASSKHTSVHSETRAQRYLQQLLFRCVDHCREALPVLLRFFGRSSTAAATRRAVTEDTLLTALLGRDVQRDGATVLSSVSGTRYWIVDPATEVNRGAASRAPLLTPADEQLCVALIREFEVPIGPANAAGNTALHLAAVRRSLTLARLLVERGASVTRLNARKVPAWRVMATSLWFGTDTLPLLETITGSIEHAPSRRAWIHEVSPRLHPFTCAHLLAAHASDASPADAMHFWTSVMYLLGFAGIEQRASMSKKGFDVPMKQLLQMIPPLCSVALLILRSRNGLKVRGATAAPPTGLADTARHKRVARRGAAERSSIRGPTRSFRQQGAASDSARSAGHGVLANTASPLGSNDCPAVGDGGPMELVNTPPTTSLPRIALARSPETSIPRATFSALRPAAHGVQAVTFAAPGLPSQPPPQAPEVDRQLPSAPSSSRSATLRPVPPALQPLELQHHVMRELSVGDNGHLHQQAASPAAASSTARAAYFTIDSVADRVLELLCSTDSVETLYGDALELCCRFGLVDLLRSLEARCPSAVKFPHLALHRGLKFIAAAACQAATLQFFISTAADASELDTVVECVPLRPPLVLKRRPPEQGGTAALERAAPGAAAASVASPRTGGSPGKQEVGVGSTKLNIALPLTDWVLRHHQHLRGSQRAVTVVAGRETLTSHAETNVAKTLMMLLEHRSPLSLSSLEFIQHSPLFGINYCTSNRRDSLLHIAVMSDQAAIAHYLLIHPKFTRHHHRNAAGRRAADYCCSAGPMLDLFNRYELFKLGGSTERVSVAGSVQQQPSPPRRIWSQPSQVDSGHDDDDTAMTAAAQGSVPHITLVPSAMLKLRDNADDEQRAKHNPVVAAFFSKECASEHSAAEEPFYFDVPRERIQHECDAMRLTCSFASSSSLGAARELALSLATSRADSGEAKASAAAAGEGQDQVAQPSAPSAPPRCRRSSRQSVRKALVLQLCRRGPASQPDAPPVQEVGEGRSAVLQLQDLIKLLLKSGFAVECRDQPVCTDSFDIVDFPADVFSTATILRIALPFGCVCRLQGLLRTSSPSRSVSVADEIDCARVSLRTQLQTCLAHVQAVAADAIRSAGMVVAPVYTV